MRPLGYQLGYRTARTHSSQEGLGIKPDTILTSQWIVAVGLLLRAEESFERGAPVDLATCLILSDTAIEAGLGILAFNHPTPYDVNRHDKLLAAATEAARVDAGLSREVGAIHKLRNTAVHQGGDVGTFDATRGLVGARRILNEEVPRAIGISGEAPGSHVATAVASVIGNHPAAEFLQMAAAARDARSTLEPLALCLDSIERSVRPPLPRTVRHVFFPRSRRNMLDPVAKLSEAGSTLDQDVRGIARWVAPMALGMSPAEYDKLRAPMPTFVKVPSGELQFNWKAGSSPTDRNAQQSLERMARLLLRIWSNDLLTNPAAEQPEE